MKLSLGPRELNAIGSLGRKLVAKAAVTAQFHDLTAYCTLAGHSRCSMALIVPIAVLVIVC